MAQLEELLNSGLLWRENMPAAGCTPAWKTARFGIEAIDGALPCGGLPFSQVHEWALEISQTRRGRWCAPLFILSALLGRTTAELQSGAQKYVLVWIGKTCWPAPQLMQRMFSPFANRQNGWNWRHNTIFLNPPDMQSRIRCISETLRNEAVLAVVADAGGLDSAALRRLQLAAKHGGSLGLLVKPPWEQAVPSTAYSRWSVAPTAASNAAPSWQLTLRRIRGTLRARQCPASWQVEWNDELAQGQGALHALQSRAAGTSDDNNKGNDRAAPPAQHISFAV